MTSETAKLKSKLATLSNSLGDLETKLSPLLSQSLPESLVDLETIQQAKLQTVLPYLVYDLIFIYLKSKGIDPRAHPVVSELDRVRQYFEKISKAEDSNQRRAGIDKEAAGRFIKQAITQAKCSHPPENATPGPSQENTDVPVPVKVTSKMIEREQYEKEMRDFGSEEEDTLGVFDDTIEEGEEDGLTNQTTKWKRKENSDSQDVIMKDDMQSGTKRRRPAVDPFAGYGDDITVHEDKGQQATSIVPASKVTTSGKYV